MPKPPTVTRPNVRGDRLYTLLALFDTRDGTMISHLVRSAREGYERSHPEMGEEDAWREFDALWDRMLDTERLACARELPCLSPRP